MVQSCDERWGRFCPPYFRGRWVIIDYDGRIPAARASQGDPIIAGTCVKTTLAVEDSYPSREAAEEALALHLLITSAE